mgnify:CR=1 FL=1
MPVRRYRYPGHRPVDDGRWLLHLDVTAGTAAERLYRAAGWTELGTMPDHSMLPDGTLAPTIFFWKDLRAS